MKKITELTEKQKSRMPEWRDRCIAIGLSTERIDKERFERAVRICYEKANLNPNVPIVHVSSPIVGAFAAPVAAFVIHAIRKSKGSAVNSAVNSAVGLEVGSAVYSAVRSAVDSAVKSKEKIFWHEWLGGSLWAGWYSIESFFREVCNLELKKNIEESAMAYAETVQSAGYWWPNRDFIMVCDRPKVIKRNNRGALHSENSMAIEWIDGWGLWMLNGIRMRKEDVMTTAEKLDPKEVMRRENVDERRELIRKIGIERMLSVLKSKVLDTKGDYSLLSVELSETVKQAHFLKMKNPSIGIWHLEGVARECETVQEAISWRAGNIIKDGEIWNPSVLS